MKKTLRTLRPVSALSGYLCGRQLPASVQSALGHHNAGSRGHALLHSRWSPCRCRSLSRHHRRSSPSPPHVRHHLDRPGLSPRDRNRLRPQARLHHSGLLERHQTLCLPLLTRPTNSSLFSAKPSISSMQASPIFRLHHLPLSAIEAAGHSQRGRHAPSRQLSLRASALRRPDAQAATPHCPRGLRSHHVGQSQQPCPRRRARQLCHGARSRSRAREDVRLSPASRPPLVQRRNLRQSRSPLDRRATPTGPRYRCLRPGPLHAHPHHRSSRPPLRRNSFRSHRPHGHGRARTGSPLQRYRHGRRHPRHHCRRRRRSARRRFSSSRKSTTSASTSTAAYGGYFTLAGNLAPEARAAYDAIPQADSIVVDPHKHGLQPYGCGAVLFRDPTVGRFYKHDSPYTYFSSKELHLGEISLECSRAGSLRRRPLGHPAPASLHPNGEFARNLSTGREAALEFNRRIAADPASSPLMSPPQLDIVF